MIAPLLSAHRSQIRERGRLALLLPPCFRQGGEAVAAISRNSELFASPWSALCVRGRWCHSSTQSLLLLPEREEEGRIRNEAGASVSSCCCCCCCCCTPACYARSYTQADMMEAQLQHEPQHQAHSTCPAISFNIRKVITHFMCMHNLFHHRWCHTPSSRTHALQCVCTSFPLIYSITEKIWIWWQICFFDLFIIRQRNKFQPGSYSCAFGHLCWG